MKKRVLVYLYPQFREVEIMVALSIVSRFYEVLTFTLPHGAVTSECGLTMQPSIKLKNINPLEYDMLLIPGGRQAGSQSDPRLIRLIKAFDRDGVRIAAIGTGVLLAGKAGVLVNKNFTSSVLEEEHRRAKDWLTGRAVNRPVVEDKNIITAKNNAYIDFGLVIGDRLGCFNSIDDYNLYKGRV